ncbi:MAG: hypothetical protein IPF99_01310 [Deltaproteobacteria bacterium]|nr:hypothetical protein [Deltaproteobacteria bacterium]
MRRFRCRSRPPTAAPVKHEVVTGDDRGGIAVSGSRLFYSGDTSTGRFDLQSSWASPSVAPSTP